MSRKVRWVRSITGDETSSTPIEGRLIPAPAYPAFPVLSRAALSGRKGADVASILDRTPIKYLSAGRMAIAQALKSAGVEPGDNVLVPAYHCSAMVEPITNLDCVPNFYRITEELFADLSDCAARIDRKTKVMICVNYFGFPQDWQAIRDFCHKNGILLLEDCAHSLYGEYRGKPLGSNGDFAITSLTKFLPSWDGGAVVCNMPSNEPFTESATRQGFVNELRAVLDPIENATDYGHFAPLAFLIRLSKAPKDVLKPLMSRINRHLRNEPRPVNPAQLKSGARGDFDLSWLNIDATFFTKILSRVSDRQKISRKRRDNFQRLIEAFSDKRGCHPLFNDLPDGIVPYMFPLWVDNLPKVFPLLEDRAVPMQRFGQFLWPDLDECDHVLSLSFSRHLIQLPCHQAIDDDAIDWIVDQVLGAIEDAGISQPTAD